MIHIINPVIVLILSIIFHSNVFFVLSFNNVKSDSSITLIQFNFQCKKRLAHSRSA
jgi:hypothetical protein